MSTPEDRFVAKVDAIRASIDRLPDEAVRAVMAELEAVRRQVLGEITATLAGGYAEYRLAQLEARLRDLLDRFAERYRTALSPMELEAFQAGARLAAQPLIEGGLLFHVPQISRRQLEVAQAYAASLITGATDQLIADITTTLRLALLRGAGLGEVIPEIAAALDSPGPFGTLATRAEAIARTELGRIQAIATQASLEDAQRQVPDLRKEWQHSRNVGKYARIGHIEAEGQQRDVAERFHVRPVPGKPYEDLLYPRDPAGTPASTVFCGCLAVPFRAVWANAIDAAKREQAEFLAARRRAA